MRKWLRTNRFVHILYMFERILIGAVPNGLNRCSRFDKMNESFEWHRMHWVDLSHHQKCGTCCAIAISIFFSSYWKLSKFHISISICRYRIESTSSFYEKQYLFTSLSTFIQNICCIEFIEQCLLIVVVVVLYSSRIWTNWICTSVFHWSSTSLSPFLLCIFQLYCWARFSYSLTKLINFQFGTLSPALSFNASCECAWLRCWWYVSCVLISTAERPILLSLLLNHLDGIHASRHENENCFTCSTFK